MKKFLLISLLSIIGIFKISAEPTMVPTSTLEFTDAKGDKFNIEIYEPYLDEDDTKYAAIFKITEPDNKIYGIIRTYKDYLEIQWDEIIIMDFPARSFRLTRLLVYTNEDNLFIKPEHSIDPRRRFPYTIKDSNNSNKISELSISDFITSDKYVEVDFEKLLNRGFSKTENDETGAYVFTKGEMTIEYLEDFDEDGEGKRNIYISFPDMDDAFEFIKPLMKNPDWKMNKAAMGEFFEMKGKNITVYHEISTVEIIETIE